MGFVCIWNYIFLNLGRIRIRVSKKLYRDPDPLLWNDIQYKEPRENIKKCFGNKYLFNAMFCALHTLKHLSFFQKLKPNFPYIFK